MPSAGDPFIRVDLSIRCFFSRPFYWWGPSDSYWSALGRWCPICYLVLPCFFFLVFLKLAGSTFLKKKNLSSSSFYTQTAERNSVNSVSISINLKKNESKRVCKDNHFTLFDQEQPGTIQIEKKTYLFNEQEIISVKPSKQWNQRQKR